MSSLDRVNPNDEGGNNKTVDGTLEMLREAGVSTESLEDKAHAFWDTQPMTQREAQFQEGPVVPNKSKEEIRAEPLNMPTGFEWITLDIMHPEQRQELYTLLVNNYVEDDDALFRFDYSKEFLSGH
jgi:glycylpeptide N-tetradecanoyltransferase